MIDETHPNERLHRAVSVLAAGLERLRPASGQEVVVAFSGGADSLALLALLGLVPRRLRPGIEAVHVDHGLRPDSARDAGRAAALAAGLGVPCRVVPIVDTPPLIVTEGESGDALGGSGGPEAAARRGRYRALAEAAAGRTIFTAHTADDQAETALYRLSKGTGLRGLAGIRPVVRLAGATVARPLLEAPRSLLHGVVEDLGLEPVLDPTNESDRFVRNRLRRDVLPALERAIGGASTNLARAARLAAADERYLSARAERARARIAVEGGCDASRLGALPEALRGRIVRRMIEEAGGRTPAAAEVDRVASLAGRQGELHLARDVVATVRGGVLSIRKGKTGSGAGNRAGRPRI